MDYILVKQLKDAGFPQMGRGQGINKKDTPLLSQVLENVNYPTLSELIEACDCPIRLWGHTDSWGVDTLCDNKADGKTPEEAVANLWLKLNK